MFCPSSAPAKYQNPSSTTFTYKLQDAPASGDARATNGAGAGGRAGARLGACRARAGAAMGRGCEEGRRGAASGGVVAIAVVGGTRATRAAAAACCWGFARAGAQQVARSSWCGTPHTPSHAHPHAMPSSNLSSPPLFFVHLFLSSLCLKPLPFSPKLLSLMLLLSPHTTHHTQ